MIQPEKAPSIEEIADHYDDLDWAYRDTWGEHVHHGLWQTGHEATDVAVLQMIRYVAERAHIRSGQAVCDVGCGYGGTARLLARELDVRVTGITLSRAQYEHALAHRDDGRNRFILGDWLSNELPPERFDAVIAIESVEHMTDKAACFREARRVLKTGGRFVFTTWLAGERTRPWERRWLLEPICGEGRLPGIGTAEEYRGLLDEAGLELCAYEDLSARVKRTWSSCTRRVASRFFTDARYRRYVLSKDSRNREFARTLPRMWLAYRTGALRYGLFTCRNEVRSRS
jgi:tocopherol O-methyltransferase